MDSVAGIHDVLARRSAEGESHAVAICVGGRLKSVVGAAVARGGKQEYRQE